MNYSSKAFATPKLTKRQVKALKREQRTTIGALTSSRTQGFEHVVGQTVYLGETPFFQIITNPENGAQSVQKVAKGLPFIRA
jgi:hypothetical protein